MARKSQRSFQSLQRTQPIQLERLQRQPEEPQATRCHGWSSRSRHITATRFQLHGSPACGEVDSSDPGEIPPFHLAPVLHWLLSECFLLLSIKTSAKVPTCMKSCLQKVTVWGPGASPSCRANTGRSGSTEHMSPWAWPIPAPMGPQLALPWVFFLGGGWQARMERALQALNSSWQRSRGRSHLNPLPRVSSPQRKRRESTAHSKDSSRGSLVRGQCQTPHGLTGGVTLGEEASVIFPCHLPRLQSRREAPSLTNVSI